MNEILIRKAKKGDKDAFCRLKMKDESMHILLTGRTLPDSLRKYADSITTLTTEIV